MDKMAYTDLVCVGDRLMAKTRDAYSGMPVVTGYKVVSRTHAAEVATGKLVKLNRRGNQAALFVGNAKVIGRV